MRCPTVEYSTGHAAVLSSCQSSNYLTPPPNCHGCLVTSWGLPGRAHVPGLCGSRTFSVAVAAAMIGIAVMGATVAANATPVVGGVPKVPVPLDPLTNPGDPSCAAEPLSPICAGGQYSSSPIGGTPDVQMGLPSIRHAQQCRPRLRRRHKPCARGLLTTIGRRTACRPTCRVMKGC